MVKIRVTATATAGKVVLMGNSRLYVNVTSKAVGGGGDGLHQLYLHEKGLTVAYVIKK